MHAHTVRSLAALACAAAALICAAAPAVGDTSASSTTSTMQTGASTAAGGAGTQGAPTGTKVTASATLEQCATATAPQTERSATFTGEMNAVPGTARMEMRIDLEELAVGDFRYRTVSAPGLGVWQRSSASVKSFTHIQQVTNLSAPALYRGAVHFRWLNARGRAIKAEELRTTVCEQPAPAPASVTVGGDSGEDGTGAPSAQ
jgi:hypothetical protein